MNDGKMSGVLFLDLRKAFDTVDHHILLCRLEEIGLGQSYVEYVKAYLGGRTQVTRVNNAISNPCPVECGVPQGSILGPLLFIVYINSLTSVMPLDVKTYLYADDTALVVNGTDVEEISANLHEALHYAGNWFTDHCLSLNLSKTKVMVHGTQQRTRDVEKMPPIVYNNKTVSVVNAFKYLGVMLDPQLTFDSHVSYLRCKVNVKMKMLCRIRQYVSQSLALQLYTTLILPDFDYADVIYDSVSQSNAKKLQVMQNQCLKVCTKSEPRASTVELHNRVRLPQLSVRRRVHTCNFVHKGINNELSKGVNGMFKYQKPRETNHTRLIDNKHLVVPRSRLDISKGNVRIRGADYYNSVRIKTKLAPSYNSFKSRLKHDLY